MQPDRIDRRRTPSTGQAVCRGPVSRREILRVGSLGLVGVTLPGLLRAEETRQPGQGHDHSPRADACILIFLNGGPSHLDMWDMKPEAPEGIRGEFKPVDTSVPGLQVSEHLPRLATVMHHFSLVRSMHHSVNNAHALAVYTSLTGHDRGDGNVAVGAAAVDYPSIGSTLAALRPPAAATVANVSLPYITKEGAGGPPQPGFFGGMLGKAYDPLFVLNDPNAANFSVPELTLLGDVPAERLSGRRGLRGQLGEAGRGDTAVDTMDRFQQRAFDLLTSAATQRAFRIGEEPDPVRERYGRNIYGQSVLLARRMIEAGTRVVTISWAPDANATWDTHGGNFAKLKSTLLPQFDAACASLVEDLAQRQLLERTLVAVLGDFGRTPKVNASQGGRDHWNYCYSLMLGGGGMRGGYVYGASDRIGAFPTRDALVPGDIIATIYHQLGLSADRWIHDSLGRPHRLVAAGNVVNDLLT
ncbi:MAG TPA: DUF1501 domain-containing protein [Pirellulales bacterium]|jgi:hypothetical protein|nr:DUF1501 domain-containing protein [Pirellulales bacterium]